MISLYAAFQAEKYKYQIMQQPLEKVCSTSKDKLCTYILEVEEERKQLCKEYTELTCGFNQDRMEYKREVERIEDSGRFTRYFCYGGMGAFLVPPVGKLWLLYGVFCYAMETSIWLYQFCGKQWTNIAQNTPVDQKFAPARYRLDKTRVEWIKKVHNEIQTEIAFADVNKRSQLVKVDETFSKALWYLQMLETIAPIELFPLRVCMKLKNSIAGVLPRFS